MRSWKSILGITSEKPSSESASVAAEPVPRERTKTLLVGHSHAWCMRSAIDRKLFDPSTGLHAFLPTLIGSEVLPGGFVLTDDSGRECLNPILEQHLKEQLATEGDRGVRVVSVFSGNHYNWLGLVRDRRAFDFVHPEAPGLPVDEGRPFLPYAAVRANFDRETAKLERLYALLLKRAGVRGVAHVEGPPPIPSEDHIKHWIREKSKGKDAEFEVGPPALRRKLWLCQRDSTRAMCERVGVTYVLPPPETIDEAGFMKQEYWLDSVHGNPAYGAILLGQIARALDTASAAQ